MRKNLICVHRLKNLLSGYRYFESELVFLVSYLNGLFLTLGAECKECGLKFCWVHQPFTKNDSVLFSGLGVLFNTVRFPLMHMNEDALKRFYSFESESDALEYI